MRSANLFFFTQPQETFEDWNQAQQNTPFEEKVEQFFAEFQQIPINYGTITDTAYQDSLYWKEQHLYGSSRLGMAKPNVEVTNYTPSNFSLLTSNFKNYELTNHLGNVLATIKDEKQQIDQNNDGIVDYYEPIVLTANDYYPFGLEMSGRNYSLSRKKYPISFNGKPDDEETGWQDYGMRMYLKKIGRFPTVDPLTQKFPWYTPYQFAGNSPIRNTDLDGAEPLDYMETWNKSNSGSLNSNTEAFTFYDVNTKQNYSVKVVHNQQGGDKYYWAAKMGADGKGVQGSSYPIGDKHHNSSEAVWQRFEPNSSVKANQEALYNMVDDFKVGLAYTAATIVTGGFGGLGVSTSFGASAISGSLDATFQMIWNGGNMEKLNYTSIAASTFFKNPFTSSFIGSRMELNYKKSEAGIKDLNFSISNKSYTEIGFETLSGGFGSKVGSKFNSLTSEGFSEGLKKAMHEAAVEGTTQGALGGGAAFSKDFIKENIPQNK